MKKGGEFMNAVLIKGRVNQVRGGLKSRWCRMTGDRFGRLSGQMLKLKGKAQVSYGRARKRLIG
jgi:uncharacterized protein YjbJ (UPF0337 family)